MVALKSYANSDSLAARLNTVGKILVISAKGMLEFPFKTLNTTMAE
jgi:hypothetical protein